MHSCINGTLLIFKSRNWFAIVVPRRRESGDLRDILMVMPRYISLYGSETSLLYYVDICKKIYTDF